MGEAVITVDAAGAVALMNRAAESWTGWSGAEACGAHVDQIAQLRGRLRTSSVIERARRSGALAEFDPGSVLVTRQGEERRIGGSASPVRGHNGEITGAVLVFGSAKTETTAARLSASPAEPDAVEIVAESPEMQRLIHFTRRVAASEVSAILLRGESGTGKDVIARFLHYHSRRGLQPFLAINCAAIPETLLESELFGYEKGAFTDARERKKGILELASGGTVFLDEIGEMPMALQAKLLRVLEDQKVRRLGGAADIQTDLRVITATNQDLWRAIEQGRFRLDLYYRLNVIQIAVPPLREHKADVIPLANHFLAGYNSKFQRRVRGVAPEAARALLEHAWPGNIRELRNAIERAMVLEEGEWIGPESLDLGPGHVAETTPAAEKPTTGLSLEEAEKSMLLHALQEAGWNQTQAARSLSISRDTLRYRMKKYGFHRAGSGV
jgi:PAS domain S-box-containing protein